MATTSQVFEDPSIDKIKTVAGNTGEWTPGSQVGTCAAHTDPWLDVFRYCKYPDQVDIRKYETAEAMGKLYNTPLPQEAQGVREGILAHRECGNYPVNEGVCNNYTALSSNKCFPRIETHQRSHKCYICGVTYDSPNTRGYKGAECEHIIPFFLLFICNGVNARGEYINLAKSWWLLNRTAMQAHDPEMTEERYEYIREQIWNGSYRWSCQPCNQFKNDAPFVRMCLANDGYSLLLDCTRYGQNAWAMEAQTACLSFYHSGISNNIVNHLVSLLINNLISGNSKIKDCAKWRSLYRDQVRDQTKKFLDADLAAGGPVYQPFAPDDTTVTTASLITEHHGAAAAGVYVGSNNLNAYWVNKRVELLKENMQACLQSIMKFKGFRYTRNDNTQADRYIQLSNPSYWRNPYYLNFPSTADVGPQNALPLPYPQPPGLLQQTYNGIAFFIARNYIIKKKKIPEFTNSLLTIINSLRSQIVGTGTVGGGTHSGILGGGTGMVGGKNVIDRKKGFKQGIDPNDSRRRREETRITVRKEKRDETLRIKKEQHQQWLQNQQQQSQNQLLQQQQQILEFTNPPVLLHHIITEGGARLAAFGDFTPEINKILEIWRHGDERSRDEAVAYITEFGDSVAQLDLDLALPSAWSIKGQGTLVAATPEGFEGAWDVPADQPADHALIAHLEEVSQRHAFIAGDSNQFNGLFSTHSQEEQNEAVLVLCQDGKSHLSNWGDFDSFHRCMDTAAVDTAAAASESAAWKQTDELKQYDLFELLQDLIDPNNENNRSTLLPPLDHLDSSVRDRRINEFRESNKEDMEHFIKKWGHTTAVVLNKGTKSILVHRHFDERMWRFVQSAFKIADTEDDVMDLQNGGAPKCQPCSTNEVYKPPKKKSIRKKKRKTNKKSKKKIIKKSPKYSKRKSIKKKSFKKSSKRNTLRKSKRKSKK